MTTPAEPSGGGGNVFTRKIGPLSTWVWMVIALAIALVYYFYKKNQSSSTTSDQNSAENTPGGTDSSLVPQFVNQTYTNVSPPSVTVNNNGGSGKSNPPPKSTKPPAKGKPPKKSTKPPTTKGGQQYTTVTVGQWPSGSGGSPSASASGGEAAWNSTLWGIATHYDVKGGYQALAKLNNISDPSLIYPGQKIKVPVG